MRWILSLLQKKDKQEYLLFNCSQLINRLNARSRTLGGQIKQPKSETNPAVLNEKPPAPWQRVEHISRAGRIQPAMVMITTNVPIAWTTQPITVTLNSKAASLSGSGGFFEAMISSLVLGTVSHGHANHE
jgi:hypothetical protein